MDRGRNIDQLGTMVRVAEVISGIPQSKDKGVFKIKEVGPITLINGNRDEDKFPPWYMYHSHQKINERTMKKVL